jgi:Mrp family chromosome partitioning ATPase
VLVLDGDLRKPSIARAIGGATPAGWLNDALAAPAETLPVSRDPHSPLSFLPSRPTVAAPQDLLASPAMRRLLRQAGEVYDFVLVDSPPLLVVSDALAMAPLLDGTVLIARWRQTTREAVALAVAELARTETPLLGVVLNQVDLRRGVFTSNDPETYRRGALAKYYGSAAAGP